MTKWINRRLRDWEAVEKIMREVCIKHQVAETEFLGRHRDARIVRARREACWRARTETKASYPTIGGVFERDYTSVMHHVQVYAEKIREISQKSSISTNGAPQTASV